MIDYSILIPAYNAQKTLPILIREIKKLERQPQNIFIVDDGSQDNTGLIPTENNVEILKVNQNRGKGHALRLGFARFLETMSAPYLLCMDADLQHPVSMINNFLELADIQPIKLVIGRRKRIFGVMPVMRIFSNAISSFVLSLICNQKIEDSQCGFRLIHCDLLRSIKLQENGFQLESELIIQATKHNVRIKFIDIPTIYNGNISYIHHLGDTYRFIRLILKAIFRGK